MATITGNIATATNQHRPINLQRSEKEGEVVGFRGC